MAPAADQRETSGGRDSSRRGELVGVGVFIVVGDEVLFGFRRGAHGDGTRSCPGGHADDGEGAEACALPELEGATGLRAVNPRSVGESEDVFPGGLAVPDNLRPRRLGRRRASPARVCVLELVSVG